MSLVSFQKYLYGPKNHSGPPSHEDGHDEQLDLINRLLSSVASTLFGSEVFADLNQQLETVRQSIGTRIEKSAALSVAGRFEALLRTYCDRLKHSDEEKAEDFRKVFAILNEAISHLDAGSERFDVRVKYLESSLHRATNTNNLQLLKSQLSEMLTFVREEAKQEADHTNGSLRALGEQVQRAHKSAARFGSSIPDKDKAIADLRTEAKRSENTRGALYVGLFVADSLPALRSRHGAEISNGILEELGIQNIRPLVADGKVYRWGPSSLVALWHSAEEFQLLSSRIAHACRGGFEHRAFVGTRMATFAVSIRSLVLQSKGDVADLLSELDRFGGGVTAP